MAGYVIEEDAVSARTTEGDTASSRLAIDASCGCERLEQQVIRFGPGRSQERTLEGRQEVLYVAEGSGTVTRVLSDDNEGSPHQRFIVTLPSGQTLLISHNIDLAHRVEGLSVGDSVSFKGEYEWNDKGGVVHWTHRDPEGRHEAGWIRHGGNTYE